MLKRRLKPQAILCYPLYLVAATKQFLAPECSLLQQLLQAEKIVDPLVLEKQPTIFKVPRPGTVSPWCSKALDIVRHCGLQNVERIEQGMQYVDKTGELGLEQLKALSPWLFDAMTEAIMTTPAELAQLFNK